MRRLLAIAFLAALPAAAQIHGVPASVTSITPSRSTPGVPASVTSLGPNGYVDPMFRPSVDPMFRRQSVDPMFRNPAYGNRCCGVDHRGFGRHPRGRHARGYYPVYAYPYSYGYPVVYAAPAHQEEEYAEEAPSDDSRDDQRYGEHYTDYREAQRRRQQEDDRQAEARRREEEARQEAESRAAAPSQPKPQDQEPVTVLVFKDGHRQDLRGYAITGDVLYDLGQGGARKIQLADLDLPATRKLNDELGNDFRLPSLPPKQN
jgi:hypothetical protein